MNFFYILGCILFTVIGQLLIKSGAPELKDARYFYHYFFNIKIIMGLSSAVVASACWIKALQFYRLSYAYPFMSLSFVFVAFFSAVLFHEPVKLNQWLGLVVVLLGLYIGSQ